MHQIDDLFTSEDLSKPENRVNVALFGMMQQDWFRKWFLRQLKLSTDAIVYPPSNVNGYRPDLKVVSSDGSVQAWIEVELGTDESQVTRYEEKFCDPIKTVWGRASDGADLSLEEIAGYLKDIDRLDLTDQMTVNAVYLRELIQKGLKGRSRIGRGPVGCEIRTTRLVKELTNRLAGKIDFTLGEDQSPEDGILKADTTKTTNNRGFSLRVKRRDTNGTVAVFSIHDGEFLIFPSRNKLIRCLPCHQNEIEVYMSLINRFQFDVDVDVDVDGNNARNRPKLSRNHDNVLRMMDEFARCLRSLAGPPSQN